MSTDPLSLFAGEDTSSSEDESVEELTTEQGLEDLSSSDKLPSPSTLFATVGKPSFLHESTDSKEIDWDHFVKNDVAEDKYSIHITDDGSYAAIPPPSQDSAEDRVYNSLSAAIVGTYNKGAVGRIAGGPVTYSSQEREIVHSGREDAAVRGVKRAAVNTSPEPEESKDSQSNKKAKTFRTKEKRKRDLGQSSRGKSYVEEEKRLLRQQFGTDAVMS